MGKVIERGKKRRAKQRKKEKPIQQYYGGSREDSKGLASRDQDILYSGMEREDAAITTAQGERDRFRGAAEYGYGDIGRERDSQRARTEETLGQNEGERIKQIGMEERYGAGSDQSLADYRSGRDSILGNASALEQESGRYAGLMEQAGGRSAGMLEGYAQNAAAEYQDAASMAARAAAEQTQRNALGIAAGRGANSVRTALAGANAANAQTALAQQAGIAQQNNQLNVMRNQAIADAANIRQQGLGGAADTRGQGLGAAAQIRSGVGSQDQAAAQLQAQRQQAAGGMAADALGMRAGLEQGIADYQLKGAGQQAALAQADAEVGLGVAGMEQQSGANRAGMAAGQEQARYGSELGGALQTDAQRQQWQAKQEGLEKAKKWTNVTTLGILGG